jgi:hypothetical protein
MAVSNWNARAIIDHLYTQLDAAKADIGLKSVSKALRTNINNKEDMQKFIAEAQQPFLYITLAPGEANNMMDHETEAGVETRIRVLFFVFLREDRDAGLLQARIDTLVKNLLDYVVARDEFRGGLATEVFPVSWVSTEEALFPDALIQIDFDFTYTWIKE